MRVERCRHPTGQQIFLNGLIARKHRFAMQIDICHRLRRLTVSTRLTVRTVSTIITIPLQRAGDGQVGGGLRIQRTEACEAANAQDAVEGIAAGAGVLRNFGRRIDLAILPGRAQRLDGVAAHFAREALIAELGERLLIARRPVFQQAFNRWRYRCGVEHIRVGRDDLSRDCPVPNSHINIAIESESGDHFYGWLNRYKLPFCSAHFFTPPYLTKHSSAYCAG